MFFFSSRRRHTRCGRDWSSDVCSSDLQTLDRILKKDYSFQERSLIRVETEENIFGEHNLALNELAVHKKDTASMITVEAYLRSEERRVGKECRSRWSP